ncbi:MAG: carboxypeptidase-like regulatory domain-containing protein [Flavobacterium sp.]|uniref:carboxypeptidase-like regulatory domain-containing protein n=1 Tax=Flavobacterium sp. TaxID=239 RepID=UPI0012227D57|nr:carboxypeptidase-like regulatory domain-containing protein [Flavobacterium sp.]RZJ67923.1 MAG: carboxypeptidase-like regulatory domain-containing protein [Flavobacterium sp.]
MKTIFLLLLPTLLVAQIQGSVKDSISGEPIPYATIWIENTEVGTNADEAGQFSISAETDKNLLFSAIGYATKKLRANAASNVVLQPAPILLDAVSVQKPKRTKSNVVGEFQMKNVETTYGCNGRPFRVARYFNVAQIPSETPYLKTISVATVSKIKGAKFNFYLIEANADGTPGSEMLAKPILASAKKGRNKTIIDVSEFKIKCSETGFFVALEWLVIPENRYEFTYESKTGTITQTSYQPTFGTQYKAENSSWGFDWKIATWKPFRKDLARYDAFENEIRLMNPADSHQFKQMMEHAKKIRTYWEEFAVEITLSN